MYGKCQYDFFLIPDGRTTSFIVLYCSCWFSPPQNVNCNWGRSDLVRGACIVSRIRFWGCILNCECRPSSIFGHHNKPMLIIIDHTFIMIPSKKTEIVLKTPMGYYSKWIMKNNKWVWWVYQKIYWGSSVVCFKIQLSCNVEPLLIIFSLDPSIRATASAIKIKRNWNELQRTECNFVRKKKRIPPCENILSY